MKQSRLESTLESAVQVGSGFFISLAMWVWAVQPLYDKKIITSAIEITALFTVSAVIRQYIFRRFFNAGIHRSIHRFARKLCETHWYCGKSRKRQRHRS